MEHKNEPSPMAKKAGEILAIIIVSAVVLAVVMIIFIWIASWYRTLL